MQENELLLKRQKQKETIARLTTPVHITQNRFEEHVKIEGYYEDRTAADFIGCDRLMKWDTLYGTVQLGYDPKKAKSFIFANIKTSIFDTAASRDQRQFNERQGMSQLKTEGENRAFSSRRRQGSAVLLYKAENKPWSERSVKPYLRRFSMEALAKTLPFVGVEPELVERRRLMSDDRELSTQEQQEKDASKLAQVRAKRVELSSDLNRLSSLIWRKQSGSRLFFRRINLVFDLQKAKMFEYYRNRMEPVLESENLTAEPAEPKEDNKK